MSNNHMTKLSKEAQELYDRYANSGATSEQPVFQLSSNGRARVQEMINQAGLTRAEAQADPNIMIRATNRALAEQRGQLPMNEGVNGRNGLGSSVRSERTGRSLSDMANGVGDE